MDYNCWFQPQGPLLLWGDEKVGPEQFAAFQKQRGLDAHSLVADPKFVDPAQHDYRLAPGQPGRPPGRPGRPGRALAPAPPVQIRSIPCTRTLCAQPCQSRAIPP